MNEIQHLYIIGNGFDIYHGINSRYENYEQWLLKNHPNILNDIIEKYGYWNGKEEKNYFWSDFENNLAEIDIIEQAKILANNNSPDYSSDHFSRDFHSSQIDARFQYETLVSKIKESFGDWIKSLNDPTEIYLPIETKQSFFITFNYTLTLEKHYRVTPEKVFHIHGSVLDNQFVLGHGKSREELEKDNSLEDETPQNMDTDKLQEYYESNYDIFIQQAYDEIIEQLSSLQKDVQQIIKKHLLLFEKLKNISHVHVYGLSFSEIDLPYLNLIHEKSPMASWEISYFSENDTKKINSFLKSNNIQPNRFRLLKLSELIHPHQMKIEFDDVNEEEG